MRIYEIDAGSKNDVDGMQEVLYLITANCTQSLHAMTKANNFLYRGSKSAPAEIFHGASRQDRTPLTSTKEFHNNINSALTLAGFKANRSNSIFCTGSMMDAVSYGGSKNIYLIFPIDGFNFTWSPKITDLYVDEYSLWGQDYDSFDKRTIFYREPNAPVTLQKEFLERTQYRDTDLDTAIRSGKEIMISGEYYAINFKYKDYLEVGQLIGRD